MLKPLYIKLYFLLMIFISAAPLMGQYTFEIVRHEINRATNSVDLYIMGLEGSRSMIFPAPASGDYLAEEIKTSNPDSVGNMSIVGVEQKEFRLLYLIDRSGSMETDQKFAKARQAISNSLKKYALPDSVVSFASFNETLSPSKTLTLSNFSRVVPGTAEPKNTFLYYSLSEKIEEWRSLPGRKVIILLTDGQDKIFNKDSMLIEPFRSNRSLIVSDAQLLTQVRNLDSLFMIHCIGFGSDVDSTILKQIVDASPNPDDKYSFAPEPDDISDIMTDLTKGQSYNLKLSVHPDDFCEYIGNTRQISLHFNYKNTILTASHAYSYGQPGAGKQSLCIGEEQKSFMELLPYAMGLVTALLIIFLTIFPFIARRRFQAKYVKRFKEVKTSNNMIVKDPITATVIQDNDKVVAYVCDHVNLLQSWKDNGDRCGVRDCYKGSAKYSTSSNFFKQSSDTTRRLNWIWFGALGGAIGWLLFKILESMGRNDGSGLLGMFSDQTNIASYNDAMSTGAGLGFGIALAFAFVEEKGQSRALDWRRILLRAVLGLFLGGIIFVLMYLIFLNVIQQFNLDFVSQFFAWLLFGMLLAVLTSVRSSIELRSALFSGLLASVAGFLVYYWSTNTGWIANDQVGKIVGMIAYGAILGVIMDTVRSSLEDFSLEFLSPAHVQRKNPISKWLKEEGAEIMIGSSPQAHVYIKWDAQVKDHHAALTYEGGKVFIVPRAQTIVNGRVLRSKASLENNDIIKLGDKSITTLRFISASREINRQKEAGTRPQNDSGIEFYS